MAIEPDFPKNPNQFDEDERISFSKLDNKFIAVAEDGTDFAFDTETNLWARMDPGSAGEAVVEGEIDSATGEQLASQTLAHPEFKQTNTLTKVRPEKKQKTSQKPQPKPKQNTAVYVTGLPSDATVSEIHDLFSRKGGLIAEEIDSHEPRIKLYKDAVGTFKGDALVVFFKPESVHMAIMLLDDTAFRYSADGKPQCIIRVQEADSSYKKVQRDTGDDGTKEPGQTGEARPPAKHADRQKVIKKTRKLDAKLADWSDEEDDRFPALSETSSKKARTVLLRHMFRIIEIEEDPASILEIKEDIREECSKLGTVTNVVLYNQEPEGIVTVKFRDVAEASACVNVMNGRPFDGRVVDASLVTEKVRFKRSHAAEDEEGSD